MWVCSHAGMIAGMSHRVMLWYCFTCSLSAFVHVGVSGSATRQECLPPPTITATHGQSLQAVGHPPGNTGYGVLICTRALQCSCYTFLKGTNSSTRCSTWHSCNRCFCYTYVAVSRIEMHVLRKKEKLSRMSWYLASLILKTSPQIETPHALAILRAIISFCVSRVSSKTWFTLV